MSKFRNQALAILTITAAVLTLSLGHAQAGNFYRTRDYHTQVYTGGVETHIAEALRVIDHIRRHPQESRVLCERVMQQILAAERETRDVYARRLLHEAHDGVDRYCHSGRSQHLDYATRMIRRALSAERHAHHVHQVPRYTPQHSPNYNGHRAVHQNPHHQYYRPRLHLVLPHFQRPKFHHRHRHLQ
jgi:hypothetical protein